VKTSTRGASVIPRYDSTPIRSRSIIQEYQEELTTKEAVIANGTSLYWSSHTSVRHIRCMHIWSWTYHKGRAR